MEDNQSYWNDFEDMALSVGTIVLHHARSQELKEVFKMLVHEVQHNSRAIHDSFFLEAHAPEQLAEKPNTWQRQQPSNN